MNCLRVRALLPLLTLALSALPAPGASDGPLDRATLKGLKSVAIIMDPLGPELEARGLQIKTISKYVEITLEQAGIPVSPDSKEFLGIRVLSAQSGGKGSIAVAVTLGVYQQVELVRDTAAKTATDTWGAQSVLLTGPNQANLAVSETIDELVQRFIGAWRAANQAEPQPQPQGAAAPPPADPSPQPK